MDDELSSVNPSINFDNFQLDLLIGHPQPNEYEQRMQEEIRENVKNELDDLIDGEISDSSEDDDSDSSSEDSQHDDGSQMDSQSEEFQSHNMPNHSGSSQFDHEPVVPNRFTDNGYSDNYQLHDNVYTDEGNHPKKTSSLADHSIESNKEADISDPTSGLDQKYESYSLSNPSDLNYIRNEKAGHSQLSTPVSSAQYGSSPETDVQEEYMKLRTMYAVLVQDFEERKQNEMKMKESYSKEFKDLKTRLSLLEEEKKRLSSRLEESNNLISDFQHQNNVLRGEINALEIQLSSERAAKTEAMSELQSKEVTIQSLEKSLRDLAQSENGLRLKQLHESILQDLKLRHEREVVSLQQNIDDLQKNLDTKVTEAESLQDKVCQLERKCKELQEQNEETYNKFTASRMQYQELFESGTVPEIGILKMKIQHSEDENLQLKNEIDHLKHEIKSLEAELHTSEALQECTLNNAVGGKEDCDSEVQLSEKKRHIQEELKKALKQLRSQRSLNQQLKKEVDEFKCQQPILEEKAKLFKSRFSEEKKKANDLEQKLANLCPKGSISVLEHENKIRAIESDLIEYQNRLQDATERLKILSANNDKLTENNKHLQTEIAKLKKEHAVEKAKTVEKYREKFLESHESAIKKIKDQHNQDLKVVREQYEHKITQLEKEIQSLNDGIYEAKAQYIKMSDENKALQTKIENMSKPKQMHDIEAKLAAEYEKKIVQLKEQDQRSKEDWAKQKMCVVMDYINTQKKQLDEEFQKHLAEERKNFKNLLEIEKAKCIQESQAQLNSLRKEYDDERTKLISAINEGSQSKSKAEIIKLQQKYEKERSLVGDYEAKIAALQNILSELKNKLSEKQNTFERVTIELRDELLAQKEKWEKEKLEHADIEFHLREKVNAAAEQEKKLRENVKKYQRHAAATEKNYKGKVTKLESQVQELKKSIADKQIHIQHLEKKYRQDVLSISEKFRKHEASLRDSACQTEDQVVLKKTVDYMKEMFMSSLKKIQELVQEYLKNMRIRNAQRLQETLYQFQSKLTSTIFQEVSRSTPTFTPSMYIPFGINSGSPINAPRTFNSPGFSDPLNHPNYKSPYSSNAFKSYEHVHSTEQRTRKSSSTDLNHKHPSESTQCGAAAQFENLSYEFVPLKLANPAFIANNMPNDYLIHGDLFQKESNVKNSFL